MNRSKYFFIFFVCSFMFVFILIFPEESFSLFPDEERIILYEDYEAISGSVELYGAVIVSDQERGRSLQLTAETFAEIKPSQALNAKAGTLSFWMKPIWE